MKNEETYTLEIARLKRANEVLKEKLNESADNKNELVNKIMDLKVKSAEKINALIAENEELLNNNVEKTDKINDLCNLTTEIQRENQVIHTALYEEQEKNVNLEITIKTLTKMVK